MQSILLGLLRHGLTAAGGALVTKGLVDQAGADQLVGALITLAGAAWSIYEKVKTKAAATPPPAA
jgi:multisubunit Na+/H+ antiporter MnhB subunit